MLELPNVTLIALTNKDFNAHKKALDEASKDIQWGARKIIWDDSITSINDWNYKIIYELHKYVDTDYTFLFHADGYPINAGQWRQEFLDYDYIGAPWPHPQDDYSYRTPDGEIIRVGNSVSIRSRKLLELPSRLHLEWRSYYGNTNEDGFLCCHNRRILEENGCRFADIEIARFFSKEHELPENKGIETFAFHTVN